MSTRQAILDLIKVVSSEELESRQLHQLSRLIDVQPDFKTVEIKLSFGYGYFDPKKVLIYLDDASYGEFPPEVAVDAYLNGVIPPLPKAQVDVIDKDDGEPTTLAFIIGTVLSLAVLLIPAWLFVSFVLSLIAR